MALCVVVLLLLSGGYPSGTCENLDRNDCGSEVQSAKESHTFGRTVEKTGPCIQGSSHALFGLDCKSVNPHLPAERLCGRGNPSSFPVSIMGDLEREFAGSRNRELPRRNGAEMRRVLFPPTTNPVTTPSIFPAPGIVTIPPLTTIPNNPLIPSVTVPSTNPATTPLVIPYSPPAANPGTVYPFPPPAGFPDTTIPGNVPFPSTGSGQIWCIAKTGVADTALQIAIDYACGYGADCSAIQQIGSCYSPNTLRDHASYAFNSYFQKNPVPSSCDFGGTAMLVNVNPSSGTCMYPSSSSSMPAFATNPSPTTVFGSNNPSIGTSSPIISGGSPSTTSTSNNPNQSPPFLFAILLLFFLSF